MSTAMHRTPSARASLHLAFGLTLTLAACSKASPTGTGASASAPASSTGSAAPSPPRIVSVGAANTEIVFALGKGSEVVGVDTSSLFPEEATKRTKVGYQRALSAEGLVSLAPSLVIVGDEAGPPAVLDQLRASTVRVETVRAEPTIEGAKSRIRAVAKLVDGDPAPLEAKLDAEIDAVKKVVATTKTRPRVLALYARGAGLAQAFGLKSAADSLLAIAGGENVVRGYEGSKPITAEGLAAADPDVVLVSTRGLESLGGPPQLFALPGLGATKAAKNKAFVAIDDLLLFGLGPRTGEGAMALAKALHPELRDR